MDIHSGREWLGIQWLKVTLYFHLREQITKRLNHGLSETILVNTLTDVREFKNGAFAKSSTIQKQSSYTHGILLCLGMHNVFYLAKLVRINIMTGSTFPNLPFKIVINK